MTSNLKFSSERFLFFSVCRTITLVPKIFRIPKLNAFETHSKNGIHCCMFVSTDVPQVVLMNKVDRLRASLGEDISDLFHSKEVHNKLADVVQFTALPDMNVLPMSNYHSESKPNTNKDILALTNLKTIIDYANDFVFAACKTGIPSGFYE